VSGVQPDPGGGFDDSSCGSWPDPKRMERDVDPGMAWRYLDVIDDHTGRWSLLCTDHYVRLTHIGALLREKAELLHRFRRGFMHARKEHPTHLRLMFRWGRRCCRLRPSRRPWNTRHQPTPSPWRSSFLARPARVIRAKCPYCRGQQSDLRRPVGHSRAGREGDGSSGHTGSWRQRLAARGSRNFSLKVVRVVEEEERDFESLKQWTCEAHRHFRQQNLWAARDWVRELDVNRVTLEVVPKQSAAIAMSAASSSAEFRSHDRGLPPECLRPSQARGMP